MFDFERGPLKLIRGGKYPHCHTLFIDDAQGALIDAASKKDILKTLNYKNPIRILINSHGHDIALRNIIPKLETGDNRWKTKKRTWPVQALAIMMSSKVFYLRTIPR